MKEIVLNKPGEFAERTAVRPVASDANALVRVRRIGVCGTDLHAFAGRQPFFTYPRVLGHELGVEVVEAPPNERGLRAGDRCAVEPYMSCGRCRACELKRPNCCAALEVLGVHVDGGMRSLLSVPVELLHRSEQLSLDQLALVETLGIGAQAISRSGAEVGETVLIVGAGPIGLAVMQFAQLTGARVRVLELNDSRREFVRGLGVDAIAEFDGEASDVVFDATGNAAAMEAAFDYIAPGGRLVLVGLVQGRISFDDPNLHRNEITVLASRNSCHEFPRIIGLIEEGEIDTTPWITHRLELEEVPERFKDLPGGAGLVKAIVDVGDAD
ncbi:MAG: zinc-binding alcohol dehydrogenase family protein [Acidobacteria bacterium]|nr:zinc-binding alcohol dehydrogenase family protein [Acidobacteriota bacterium]